MTISRVVIVTYDNRYLKLYNLIVKLELNYSRYHFRKLYHPSYIGFNSSWICSTESFCFLSFSFASLKTVNCFCRSRSIESSCQVFVDLSEVFFILICDSISARDFMLTYAQSRYFKLFRQWINLIKYILSTPSLNHHQSTDPDYIFSFYFYLQSSFPYIACFEIL